MIEVQDRCGNKLFRVESLPSFITDEYWFGNGPIPYIYFRGGIYNQDLLDKDLYQEDEYQFTNTNNQMEDECLSGFSLSPT